MSFEPKRISELDSIPSLANGDLLVVVDISDTAAGTTKKATILDLINLIGGGGAIDASNITSGTLANARLTANVTLKGNTFNGSSQLVELSAAGLYPSNDGSQITNLNATNLASGSINAALLPITIARTKKIIVPLITAATINLTESSTDRVIVCGHTSGTMLFNLDVSTGVGSYFTIINISTGDIQINTAGNLKSPTAVGNVSLTGRTPGSRRVEIICVDPSQFVISGDLL
jgi:hypothetical protein